MSLWEASARRAAPGATGWTHPEPAPALGMIQLARLDRPQGTRNPREPLTPTAWIAEARRPRSRPWKNQVAGIRIFTPDASIAFTE